MKQSAKRNIYVWIIALATMILLRLVFVDTPHDIFEVSDRIGKLVGGVVMLTGAIYSLIEMIAKRKNWSGVIRILMSIRSYLLPAYVAMIVNYFVVFILFR
ncbi:MAG: hypothetical protein WCL27_07625 [Betaproteobacteria bacterium]